jgi:A/G-specific adenine glycosylase
MTILTSISPDKISKFQKIVWDFYRTRRRAMPWRAEPTPYYVMVSELMLQQTQVARVMGKFPVFVRRFPTIQDLAAAQLGEVLEVWSGLGYNRRAKFLWQAAQVVVRDFGGEIPRGQKELVKLPGIGVNTAGAILAYAYNEPAVFIETNVRTVFIHHFFDDNMNAVADDELRQVVAAALPLENPREWYWAVMDYGTELKSSIGAQLHRVKNYRPQSTFKGSRREVRGKVIKTLVEQRGATMQDLSALIFDERLEEVCESLVAEGMITRRGDAFYLTDA